MVLRKSQVLQAIPNALGALCLNDVGQTQLARRPSIIPGILSVFTSERHLKVLLDKENSVLLGTAIDELIRHHPSLRTPVFDALRATIAKIEELGIAYEVPEDSRHSYRLVPSPISTDGDVAMEGVESAASTSRSDVTLHVEDAQTDILEDDIDEATNKNQGNHIVSFIDVLGRVREVATSLLISLTGSTKVFGRSLPTYTSL
jgi:E3 ubiquitin-protein ligase HUWE1